MGLKEIVAFVFLDVAIVVIVARLMGKLFRRFGQPAVIGEITAGILLGPTLLGLFPGGLDEILFPLEVRPYLNVIAQIGLVLFMFIVGLEIDLSLIRKRGRVAGVISMTSIALPFGLGFVLATYLHANHDVFPGTGEPIGFLPFALFLGVAMSITAFPVLARILTDRGMHRTPTGALVLACAAIDDVLAWSLLAIVVAVGSAGGDLTQVARILGLTAVFAVLMAVVVRPLLGRMVPWYQREGRLNPDMLAVVLAGLLISAYITETIEVHAIFGAFVFGAMMPRRGAAGLTREILERIEQVSLLLLLPVFFVVTGLQVNISAIDGTGLVELLLILLVAIGGKFVGAATAARVQRVPRRQAGAIGLLMNTRGLTELVILTVGVQLGVLDPELFTLMVVMALVTTAMAAPLLKMIYPDRMVAREIAEAERAELGEVDAHTVLVAVPPEAPGPMLVGLATELTGRESPALVVLCRLLPSPVRLEVASGLGTDLTVIAAAGDELRGLARDLEAAPQGGGRGVRCSVVARFSTDPAADLAALAARVSADVVLVAARDASGEPGAPGNPVTEQALATLVPGTVTHGPVVVLVDGSAATRSALRLAAQIALARGDSLLVDATGRRATRRAGAAIEALRRHGVPVEAMGPATPVPALLVVPAGAPPHPATETSSVLRVNPGQRDADEDLDQVVARIATALPATPDAAATREPAAERDPAAGPAS